jgi:hypothetical protein
MRVPSVRSLALGVLLVAVLGAWTRGAVFAQAQSVPDSVRRAALEDFHGPDLEGKDGPLAKAGLDLLLLYHRHRSRPDRALSVRAEDASEGGMQIQDGRVVIDAIAAGDVEALAADLDSLGMTDVASAGGLVSGRLPIEKIPALARLSTLRGATPSRMRTRSARPERGTASTRTLRPADDDRAPPRGATPESPETGDSAEASAATPGDADAEAPDSSTASSAHPPAAPATEPAAAAPAARSSDDAGDATTILLALAVLLATVLFIEER